MVKSPPTSDKACLSPTTNRLPVIGAIVGGVSTAEQKGTTVAA
jgi:hypothetical protein